MSSTPVAQRVLLVLLAGAGLLALWLFVGREETAATFTPLSQSPDRAETTHGKPDALPRAERVAEVTEIAPVAGETPRIAGAVTRSADPALGGPLRIQVQVVERVDGEPLPVAEARVHARLYSELVDDGADILETANARTGADGMASLVLATAGSAYVTAASGDRVALGVIEDYLGGDHHLVLELAPTFRVRGVVVDARDARPIEGAHVSFANHGRLGLAPVRTDELGQFEIGHWEPGASSGLDARADGYGREQATLHVAADGSWDTATFGAPKRSGASDPFVEIALLPEKTIVGRAVDGLGRPIPCARVAGRGYLVFMQGALAPDFAVTETEANGRFRLSGLRSDLTHAVWIDVRDEGRATAVAPKDELAVDLGDVVVRAGVTVRGSIVDAAGRPVAGVRAELAQLAPTDRETGTLFAKDSTSRDGWSKTVRYEEEVFADANGAFAFRGLPSGSFRLSVHAAEVRRTLEVADIDVDLEPFVAKETLAMLHGFVSRDGERVRGARVDVTEPGRQYRASTSTDEYGRFAVSAVEEGVTYFVRVLAPDHDASHGAEGVHGQLVTFDGSPLAVEL